MGRDHAKLMPSFSAADPSRAPSPGDFFCFSHFSLPLIRAMLARTRCITPVACLDLASLLSFLQSIHICVLHAYGIKSNQGDSDSLKENDLSCICAGIIRFQLSIFLSHVDLFRYNVICLFTFFTVVESFTTCLEFLISLVKYSS